MIEDGEVQRFRRAGQLARRPAVGVTWPGVAGRVVVRQYDPGAAIFGRVRNNFPNGYPNLVRFPIITFDMEAASRFVDVGNPQPLTAAVVGLEAGVEKTARRLMAIEERRRFGTLKPHAATLWKVLK